MQREIITEADIIKLISNLKLAVWRNGFIAATHKHGSEVVIETFRQGLAATVQYTELDIPLSWFASKDPSGVAPELLLAVGIWYARNKILLKEKNAKLSGFYNSDRGVLEIGIAIVFLPEYMADAKYFAEDGNQISMWDFSANNGKGGEISTGGTGIHPMPPEAWQHELP